MGRQPRSTHLVMLLILSVLPLGVAADDPREIEKLREEASHLKEKQEYPKAIAKLEAALALAEQTVAKDSLTVAELQNSLAILYYTTAQYGKAEPLYMKSLAIKEAKLGKEHLSTAGTMQNLASLYERMGRYAKAEPLYLKALAVKEAKLGRNHPDTARTMQNLALLHESIGQTAKAEALYVEALAIYEAKLGKEHPDTAGTMQNLALLYEANSQYAKAEPLYRQALAVYEQKLGKDHPETARTTQNLASLYSKTGQYPQAEPLYWQALKSYEAKLGKEHPSTARTMQNLASLYGKTGQFSKAEPLAVQAIDSLRARLGKDHPSTISAIVTSSNLYAAQDRYGEAIRARERATQGIRRHLLDVIPILNQEELSRFLVERHDRTLAKSLALGLQPTLSDEQRYRLATWLVNGKGLATAALAERTMRARDANSEAAKQVLAEWDEVQRQLAKASLNGSNPVPLKEVEAWHERRRVLETRLHAFDGRTQRDDPWYDLDELRQRLRPAAAYIDFTRVPAFDFKKSISGPEHYVAFISFKNDETQIVDLGAASKIDAAIAKVRKELESANQRIRQHGEIEAEKTLREPLTALAQLVLQPLRKYLDDKDTWIVSPDSNLWLFPWAMLPLDANTYAIEKHSIHYVVSGRDLLVNPLLLDRKTTQPVIVADPDFDVSLGHGAADTRGLSKDFKLGNIRRLPGTATEAEAIAPKLQAFAKAEPTMLLEGQATTANVRKIKNPSVLVMSTHGFFLEDEKTDLKDHELVFDGQRRSKVPENPLLRCGLLLAGCNNPGKNMAGDTGVLTGLEIVGCDLRGTKLVVLSACETGLGDVQSGQGVAGLRQAFQLAGAECVVATLWQIPDQESARLMVNFFAGLAQGETRSAALQKAQRLIIEERRKRFGAAHPFFWAAYTVTGQNQ